MAIFYYLLQLISCIAAYLLLGSATTRPAGQEQNEEVTSVITLDKIASLSFNDDHEEHAALETTSTANEVESAEVENPSTTWDEAPARVKMPWTFKEKKFADAPAEVKTPSMANCAEPNKKVETPSTAWDNEPASKVETPSTFKDEELTSTEVGTPSTTNDGEPAEAEMLSVARHEESAEVETLLKSSSKNMEEEELAAIMKKMLRDEDEKTVPMKKNNDEELAAKEQEMDAEELAALIKILRERGEEIAAIRDLDKEIAAIKKETSNIKAKGCVTMKKSNENKKLAAIRKRLRDKYEERASMKKGLTDKDNVKVAATEKERLRSTSGMHRLGMVLPFSAATGPRRIFFPATVPMGCKHSPQYFFAFMEDPPIASSPVTPPMELKHSMTQYYCEVTASVITVVYNDAPSPITTAPRHRIETLAAMSPPPCGLSCDPWPDQSTHPSPGVLEDLRDNSEEYLDDLLIGTTCHNKESQQNN